MNNISNKKTKFQDSFSVLGTKYVGSEIPFAPSTKFNKFFRYNLAERKCEWKIISATRITQICFKHIE